MSTSDPPRTRRDAIRLAFDKAAPAYDREARLQREVADRLLERLDFLRLDPITVLDLGAGTGYCTRHLARRYRKARILGLDLSWQMTRAARRQNPWFGVGPRYLTAAAEQLPLLNAAVDLLLSNLTLQWCSHLPAVFAEFTRVLKPGAPLLFTTFGPGTLSELRAAWAAADAAVHVNPFPDMHDVGDMLVRAGFRDVVMDADRLIHYFPDTRTLMKHLKRIGAHNTNPGRPRGLTGKRTLESVNAAYEQQRTHAGLPASFEIVFAHAWCPEAPGHIYVPAPTLP